MAVMLENAMAQEIANLYHVYFVTKGQLKKVCKIVHDLAVASNHSYVFQRNLRGTVVTSSDVSIYKLEINMTRWIDKDVTLSKHPFISDGDQDKITQLKDCYSNKKIKWSKD